MEALLKEKDFSKIGTLLERNIIEFDVPVGTKITGIYKEQFGMFVSYYISIFNR